MSVAFLCRCLAVAWQLCAAGLARAQVAPSFDSVRPVGTPAEEHQPYTLHDAQGNDWLVGFFKNTFQIGGVTLTSAGGIDLYVAKFDSTGICRWATRAGGPGDDYYYHGALDRFGNAYLAGTTTSPQLELGTSPGLAATGTGRIFLLRLSASGHWRWGRLVGNSATDALTGLTTDGYGPAFVTGLFGGSLLTLGSTTLTAPDDGFVARLDTTGHWAWAVPTRSPLRFARLAADNANHLYLAGSLTGSGLAGPFALASAGGTDVALARLAASTGTWQWAQRAGGPADDGARDLLCHRGRVYLAGSFASFNAQFGTLTSSPIYGNADAFVARLTPAGAFEWISPGGSLLADAGCYLAADAAGSIYLGGQYAAAAHFGTTQLPNQGNLDLFVAKLDSTGQYQWAVGAGSDDEDQPLMLASAGHPDDLLLSGYFFSDTLRLPPLAFPGDPSVIAQGFLARLTASPLALRTVSPASGQPGQSVRLTGTRLGGVRQVFFNGVAATSLSEQSAYGLRVTVPAGATNGPVSVRNAAGSSATGPAFQVQVLAALTAGRPATPLAWPVPARAAEPLHLALAAPTATYTLRTALGGAVRTGLVSTTAPTLPTIGLAPGVYFLTLTYQSMPASTTRLVVE